MNTFDMILEEMIKSGQIPRSIMGPQKNKTWVDRLADALDARTQLVTQAKQAKMPGTPSEQQQFPPASKFGKFANSLGNAADITGNQALSNAANLASVAKFMMK